MSEQTIHFVIMGICGCGKTTVAKALQRYFNCAYAEGDDFHTQANRDKMEAGIPLNDNDRYPWLHHLRDWMTQQTQQGEHYSIVTCSALKRRYRDILRGAKGHTIFIHLTPSYQVNLERILARKGHYMKAEMIQSQLEILEELDPDEEGICIDNSGKLEEIERDIIEQIKYFISPIH